MKSPVPLRNRWKYAASTAHAACTAAVADATPSGGSTGVPDVGPVRDRADDSA